MKAKHIEFEKLFNNDDLKKTDFTNYSKILYFTTARLMKINNVPSCVIVILKNMIYKKELMNSFYKFKIFYLAGLTTLPRINV